MKIKLELTFVFYSPIYIIETKINGHTWVKFKMVILEL